MAPVPPPELPVEDDPLEFEVGKPPAAARTKKEKMYVANVKNLYDMKTPLKSFLIISRYLEKNKKCS
jgi:hypothetical protein